MMLIQPHSRMFATRDPSEGTRFVQQRCSMTPSVLLSTSLAFTTLAPAVLQVGTARADTSRLAFVVSTSRGSAPRPQAAHNTTPAFCSYPAATSPRSLGLRRRRTSSQQLLSSWPTDCSARRSQQRRTEPAESMAMLSRGIRRRWFSVLGAAGTSFSDGTTSSEASGDGAQQPAWRRGGGDATGTVNSVDQTAPSGVQRMPSVRGQLVQMLKPDLPRVSMFLGSFFVAYCEGARACLARAWLVCLACTATYQV